MRNFDHAAETGNEIRWHIGDNRPRQVNLGWLTLTVLDGVQVYDVGNDHGLTFLRREVRVGPEDHWVEYWHSEQELREMIIAENFPGFDNESIKLLRADKAMPRHLLGPLLDNVHAAVDSCIERIFPNPIIDIEDYARSLGHLTSEPRSTDGLF